MKASGKENDRCQAADPFPAKSLPESDAPSDGLFHLIGKWVFQKGKRKISKPGRLRRERL